MGDAQTAAAIKKYESLWKHPELFLPWQSDVFDARFLELQKEISDGASAKTLLDKGLLQKEVDGVFSFPMFQLDFCDKFLEEVDNYFASGLPVRRPNSMNNYGLIVNEIGLEPSITHLQQNYILPLARLLYPIQVMMHTHAQKTVPLSPLPLYLSAPLPLSYPPPLDTHTQGKAFHAHHSFMVEYKAGHDLGLDMHTDDSDVTLNICLGREFEGAGLTFCGSMGAPDHRKFSTQYAHVRGRAVIHLGTKRHGADDITSGERNNLIIWNHNLDYRQTEDYHNRPYSKEDGAPDVRCLSYTHDRDYEAFMDVPAGRHRPERGGWCPPRQYCYDQMEPIALRVAKRSASSAIEKEL